MSRSVLIIAALIMAGLFIADGGTSHVDATETLGLALGALFVSWSLVTLLQLVRRPTKD